MPSYRTSLVALAIFLTAGTAALIVASQRTQAPVVVLDVEGYTNRDDCMEAEMTLSNVGPTEVKLDAFFSPTFRVRAHTPNAWTNYDVAEVLPGNFVPPGSKISFNVTLPRHTLRWELTTYVVTIASSRAQAMKMIPWAHNTGLNTWLFRLRYSRWAIQPKAFEVTGK